MTVQLAFPGMEPPPPIVKPRPLWDLFLNATADYWGPIAERLASECELGPEGLTERHLVGIPEFMDLDAFRADLDAKGVPYK